MKCATRDAGWREGGCDSGRTSRASLQKIPATFSSSREIFYLLMTLSIHRLVDLPIGQSIASDASFALFQACLNSLSFFFVTRFFKQSKHVLFVGFYTGLVKWIYFQQVATDTACFFKEVNKLTNVVSI